MKTRNWLGTLALGLALAACGQVSDLVSGKKKDAEVRLTEYPEQVYFGDTHLHTANSSDAFGLGVRLGPEEALRFARGEEVTSTTGLKAKLARPLDFLVIADHSDGLAALKQIHDAPRFMLRDPILQRWHDELQKGPKESQAVAHAKRLATDAGYEAVNGCLQLHGGYGYLRDHPIERVLRDVRVHQILEGTNEIMRLIVSRDLLEN